MSASERDLLLEVKGAVEALNQKVDGSIAAVRSDVDRHDRSLYGNGQPGITKRLDVLENNQTNCPARASAGEESKANRRMFIVSCGMLLVAAATLLVTYLKG